MYLKSYHKACFLDVALLSEMAVNCLRKRRQSNADEDAVRAANSCAGH